MNSRYYKMRDLKSWNNLQLKIIRDLGIPEKPDYITAVAEWFVGLVDQLGRIPTWDEILSFFPGEMEQGKSLS